MRSPDIRTLGDVLSGLRSDTSAVLDASVQADANLDELQRLRSANEALAKRVEDLTEGTAPPNVASSDDWSRDTWWVEDRK